MDIVYLFWGERITNSYQFLDLTRSYDIDKVVHVTKLLKSLYFDWFYVQLEG